jgi:HK97 family phage major capsid protein
MDTAFVKRLQEERLNTWESTKALLDRAADEKRDLSAEENQTYERANARIDEIDARVKDVLEAQKRSEESAAAFESLLVQPAERSTTGPRDENAEVRAWLKGESGRAFDVRPEARSTQPLEKKTSTAGPETVPTSFYGRLVQHLIVNSGVLQSNPTVLTTAGGEALQIPKTTAHSTSAVLVAEAGTLPQNTPTFGQVTLDAYKYGFLMTISHELLNDTGVDLLGYLSAQAGRALGNGFGAALVTGDGSSKPHGVLAAATDSGLTTTGTGTAVPKGDDLIDLFYSVIAPYRNSSACGWLMADATVGVIRKVKDSTGQYIWQPGLQAGAPDLILGKPVNTDPNMPALADTAKSILFGDFSAYYVRRVETIRFERSDDFAFNTDQVTFRAILRGDGDMVDTTGALKYLTGDVVA